MSHINNITGMIGVGKAIDYFLRNGWMPFIPQRDILPYDMVIGNENDIKKVSIKAANNKAHTISLQVRSKRAGKNVIKKANIQEFDMLFCYDMVSHKCFCIPSSALKERETLCLVSECWKEFLVE